MDESNCRTESSSSVESGINNATEDNAGNTQEELCVTVDGLETPIVDDVSDNLGLECTEDDGALRLRLAEIHAAGLSEKRSYDYLVNRLDKRFSKLEGRKNKAQNESNELSHSVKSIMRKINDIEKNLVSDDSASRYVDPKGVKGPPLPSQHDMFMLAYENGQVRTSYSKFNQRQWSAQKYSYPAPPQYS